MIRSDEGLTLETSASESLYGGQFTLSTQLIKPNYLTNLTDWGRLRFLTADSVSTVGGGVKMEREREEDEIEEEVAMVDKVCGAVTWVGT